MPTQDPLSDDALQRHRWALGARIRAERLSRRLSQVELAERAGLDHKTISRAENGRTTISIDVLLRIAHALEAPPWRLFRDD